MPVTTVLRSLGSWAVTLRDDTPKYILDALKYFGHITVHPGRVDPRVEGDSMLTTSRYTGVYRARRDREDGYTDIGGVGMAVWLGDEDGKGAVIETLVELVNEPFHTAIPQLIPTSLQTGTIFNISKDFSGSFQYVSPRQAIDYITQTLGAAWRVNGDGTVDAGLEADLFVTEPKVIIARNNSGRDMRRRALHGYMNTDQDVEDFTTRVVLLASDPEGSYSTGDADILPGLNVYKDLFGNPVKFTRLVNETGTSPDNADARAQLQLNRFTGTRDSLGLTSHEYDIPGDIEVGDYLWVWDPEKKILDYSNEVYAPWGELINPRKLQLTEMSWPVDESMSICFRDSEGKWFNLTDYFIPETGAASINVGGYNRSLTSGDGGAATQPPPPTENLTIPGQVQWVEGSFLQSTYQSVAGETKAQTELVWLQPDNTDLSNITDGDHYEIRYRTSTVPLFPVTHAQMAVYTHQQLADNGGTWGNPIHYPVTEWQYLFVPFDKLRAILYELTPSMPYEAQIRAVDTGSFTSPPNAGAWSVSTFFQTSADTLPPAIPAPPEVAASLIAVQITHFLGRADGGTFNLDADIHHLEIHGESSPSFNPTNTTLIGKLLVNYGMISGEIPAVGTFNINELVPVYFKVIAVDTAGNKSLPSSAVMQSASLIDDAHISSLTVSKVTAGTITATWLMGGLITTAMSGNRVQMDINGIRAYNTSGVNTVFIKSSDGTIDSVGSIKSGLTGSRIVINPAEVGGYIPEIRMYPTAGSTYAYINAPATGSVASIGMNSGQEFGAQTTLWLFSSSGKLAYTDYGSGLTIGAEVRVAENRLDAGIYNELGQLDGGIMQLLDIGAWFGVDLPSGLEAWMHIPSSTGRISWKGYVDMNNAQGGHAAMFFDREIWGGGAVGITYGATMVGAMCPIGSWTDFGGYSNTTVTSFHSATATGCTISNGINGRNGMYSVMVFRTDQS